MDPGRKAEIVQEAMLSVEGSRLKGQQVESFMQDVRLRAKEHRLSVDVVLVALSYLVSQCIEQGDKALQAEEIH